MSETINVTNVSISQIDNGENFQSPENPLAYTSAIVDGSVTVGVIVPFHNNVDSTQLPSISVSVSADGNDVFIQPQYNHSMPLSDIFTQVVKISFTLNDVIVEGEDAVINITVDEEGKPDGNPHDLGDPKKKTKVIANGG